MNPPKHPPPQRAGFAYERVSTDSQQHAMQRTCNLEYAARHAIPIMHTSTDTASGALPWIKRGITMALGFSNPDDTTGPAPAIRYTDVIVYELSRIGRDLSDTLRFLSDCAVAGITVHISRTGTRIDAGINGKIMATVFGLAADIEREFLITRTRDALAERKTAIEKNGGFTSKSGVWRKSLGRPVGSKSASKLATNAEAIRTMIAAKVPDSAIARLQGCSRATVARFRASINSKES
jgi:DNA invertase Pin-like site-specific DNA recombinase